MKKSVFIIIFLISINLGFSQTNDENYKSLLTEFLNVQGGLKTFDSTQMKTVITTPYTTKQ